MGLQVERDGKWEKSKRSEREGRIRKVSKGRVEEMMEKGKRKARRWEKKATEKKE